MKVTPFSQTVEMRHSAKFTTIASGVGVEGFLYQWRHNGINISGETGDTLSIQIVNYLHKGEYECIVTNRYGEHATSNKVQLYITSKLLN